MGRYYDRQLQPISFRRWTELHGDSDYVRVALTKITPEVEVSTVWLGLDHSFGFGGGTPIVFETMIFYELDVPIPRISGDGEFTRDGQEQWRWTCEQEAIEGHARICASLYVPDSPEALERERDV